MNFVLVCSSLWLLLSFHALNSEGRSHVRKTTTTFFTHFKFGSNATSFVVAGPRGELEQVQPVGSIVVFDNVLTKTASKSSQTVGRMQGYFVTDAHAPETSFLVTFTMSFHGLNGSIVLQGQDPVNQAVREVPIVGGSESFRFARGYAELRTIEFVFQVTSTVQIDLTLWK